MGQYSFNRNSNFLLLHEQEYLFRSASEFVRVCRCLLESLELFRKAPGNSTEDELFWSECEKLFLEQEELREHLPEEIADLLQEHVRRSQHHHRSIFEGDR